MLKRFWDWYERNHHWNLAISSILFLWQLVHLYWLTTDVVWARLFGYSIFNPSEVWRFLLVIVDYTEIPALITTSILYANEHRKKWAFKNILFLIFLNAQWLHLFWITDEFVVSRFAEAGSIVALPIWLAWTAILIDYLELPVIFDTTWKFLKQLRDRSFGKRSQQS